MFTRAVFGPDDVKYFRAGPFGLETEHTCAPCCPQVRPAPHVLANLGVQLLAIVWTLGGDEVEAEARNGHVWIPPGECRRLYLENVLAEDGSGGVSAHRGMEWVGVTQPSSRLQGCRGGFRRAGNTRILGRQKIVLR